MERIELKELGMKIVEHPVFTNSDGSPIMTPRYSNEKANNELAQKINEIIDYLEKERKELKDKAWKYDDLCK